MISILSIVHDTMVDGPGFRTSIYWQVVLTIVPNATTHSRGTLKTEP